VRPGKVPWLPQWLFLTASCAVRSAGHICETLGAACTLAMQTLRRALQHSTAVEASGGTFWLRVASVFIVAIVSFCGCSLALFVSRSSQGSYVNRLLKCTAAGVIACVGFVHILPDSAELLGRVTTYPLAYVIAMSGAFMLLLTNQVGAKMIIGHKQGGQQSPKPVS
jgi:hypothetical protein